MSTIRRVAVLGLGSMGCRHLENALALGLEIVGFDQDRERGAEVAATFGVHAASSRAEALESADAVIIASPSAAHIDDLGAALDAGCHVLAEKPFADRTDGLGTLLTRAELAGLNVAVGQNLRFHPAVARAHTRLAEGKIGPVLSAVSVGASYLPDWRPGQDYRKNYAADPRAGGVIFDWVHEIDMLAHLLGRAVVEGAAATSGQHLDIPSDEQAGLVLRHTGGALSTVLLSYVVRPAVRRTMLLGPDGGMEIDIAARRLTISDAGGRVIEEEKFGGRHADDYRVELADFIAAAESGRAPRCPGWEALEILTTVADARRLAGLPCASEDCAIIPHGRRTNP